MTEPVAKDMLRKARALIATPDKWTQGAFARNANGYRVDEKNALDVVSRCASGAIKAACRSHHDAGGVLAAVSLKEVVMKHAATNRKIMSVWNDEPERTHAEVLQAFDRAIENS